MKIKMNIPAEELRKMNMALMLYHKGLNKEANRLVIEHGRLLARDLIKYTPPFEKKVGENAVVSDISKTMHAYSKRDVNDKEFNKRMKQIENAKDYVAFNAIIDNIPALRQFTAARFNKEFHQLDRKNGFDDVLNVPFDRKRLTLDREELKNYRLEIKGNVGKLKSTWMPMLTALNVTAPNWVTKWASFGNQFTTCKITVGDKPSIVVWNGGDAQKYLKHAAEQALQHRVRAMVRDLEYKIRYMKNKIGQE